VKFGRGRIDLTGNGRFPDNHFPRQTFPGQFVLIILNTLECSCSKINDELSCAPCTYDYMLLIIFFSLYNSFSFIIVSLCVAFIFHLIITKFRLYPLLDYTFYRIVPVYLLPAYKHTSVDATYTYRVTRPIELVFTHYVHENSLV